MPKASAFARPLPGLITTTSSGGVFTLLAYLTVALLLLSECYQFWDIDQESHLKVKESKVGHDVKVREGGRTRSANKEERRSDLESARSQAALREQG